jgi:hypothetical protein
MNLEKGFFSGVQQMAAAAQETMGAGLAAIKNLGQAVRPNTAGTPAQPTTINAENINAVKQALAKNFAKKLNPKKLEDDAKQSMTELRNQFLIYLSKVYSNDTKKEGVIGCHRIIEANRDNP